MYVKVCQVFLDISVNLIKDTSFPYKRCLLVPTDHHSCHDNVAVILLFL